MKNTLVVKVLTVAIVSAVILLGVSSLSAASKGGQAAADAAFIETLGGTYNSQTDTGTISGIAATTATYVTSTGATSFSYHTNLVITSGSLTISNGFTFTMTGTLTLTGDMIVGSTGTFNNLGTTVFDHYGAEIYNIYGGTVNNRGTITDLPYGWYGAVDVSSTSTLNNYGVITVDNYGAVEAEGDSGPGATINNYGTINLLALTSSLDIGYNSASSTLNNFGTIYDYGTINNYGTTGTVSFVNKGTIWLYNFPGLIINSGDSFVNSGTIYYVLDTSTVGPLIGGTGTGLEFSISTGGNTFSGIFAGFTATLYIPSGTTLDITTTTFGPLTIASTGTVDNYGTLIVFYESRTDSGVLNVGTFNNYGTMTLGSTTGSTYEGTDFINTGTFNNYGSINYLQNGGEGIANGGTFNNYGSMTIRGVVQFQFQNSGTFVNEATGTIKLTGMPFDGAAKGFETHTTLDNYGTITITSTGQLTVYGQGSSMINENGGTIWLYTTHGLIVSYGTLTNGGTIYLVLDSSTFSSLFGSQGSWDESSLTGTITGSATFSGGSYNMILYILSNTTLTISNSVGTGLTNKGTIDNYGTINVENTGGTGIYNTGTIYNYGTVNVDNSGGTGVNNAGTVSDLVG